MNGPSSPKQLPPDCSPFSDSEPHASCLSLHRHIWAGSPIAPVSPEPSNVRSQLWQGLGHTVEGPSPDLCPTQPLLCILPADMSLFPFQWLCHANPPSSLLDVQQGDLLGTCPFATPDLSVTGPPPGTGNDMESGFLELTPKDFPDPYGQKQRRLLCFAILYRMFTIMLL